jgi:hypothetical protein
LPLSDYLRWGAGTVLEILLLCLVLRRGLARRFPFFLLYLCLLVLSEVGYLPLLARFGHESHAMFLLYWVSQEVLVIARGLVVVEICSAMLRSYKGIWSLCRLILSLIAGLLVLATILSAQRSGPWLPTMVYATERGLELTIVGILLFGLAFCRHYRVEPEPPIPLMALGLGIYSAIQVANDTLLGKWLYAYFPLWSLIRVYSFDIALGLWLVSVWRTLPERRPVPTMLDRGVYEGLSPVINLRLRELNSRLLGMLK